jgi:hypothetical protein
LQTAIYGDYDGYHLQDVTDDSIPELMFLDFDFPSNLHIFYCREEKYKLFTFDSKMTGFDVQEAKLVSITCKGPRHREHILA